MLTNGVFSPDVLRRSTYFDERDPAEAFECYSDVCGALCEKLRPSSSALNWFQSRLRAVRHRIDFTATDCLPDWISFLPKLLAAPDDTAIHQTPDTAAEIFAEAFWPAASWLTKDLGLLQDDSLSISGRRSVSQAVEAWFLKRAVSFARYVLYLSQSTSGLGYKAWSGTFLKGDEATNPWFEIAAEYPVLIRQISELHANVSASVSELLARLVGDREAIADKFDIHTAIRLDALEPNLSDPHRGGRSVMRLRFENGRSLIYKPKPIQIEAEINDLANESPGALGLRSLKVLACCGYGWVEDAGPQDSHLDMSDLGRAAAFYWFLNATDLHFENVRPSRGGVASLDLETLLAAPVGASLVSDGPRWRQHSVNATMLFDPSVFARERANNISGFDPSPLVTTPSAGLIFVRDGDRLKIAHLKTLEEPGRRSPDGDQATSNEVESLLAAFVECVSEQRHRLIDFVKNVSGDCRLRMVLRDTFFYAQLQERMRQPRFLRDGALMSLDLLALHAGVSAEGSRGDALHRIVDDEIRQILRGDIPYFSYAAGERELRLSDGSAERIFDSDSKSHALSKLSEAGPSDINEQTALIRIALGRGPPPRTRTTVVVGDASLTGSLSELAQLIASSAFRPSDAPARWLSLYGDVAGRDLRVGVGDRGFFGGSWGILMALQAAERVLLKHSDVEPITNLLDDDAEKWCAAITDGRVHLPRPGEPIGFAGVGGILFAQATLLKLQPERWGTLERLIELELSALDLTCDNDQDVIGGAAGFILGADQLLELGIGNGIASHVRHLCSRAAQSLIVGAEIEGRGASWRVAGEDHPLLSYAHGWSGIVVALATAMQRSSDAVERARIGEILSTAFESARAELELHGAWLDHRSLGHGKVMLNRSWCNGTAGLLRGLLEYEAEPFHQVSSEARSLVMRIRNEAGSGDALRFCCGEMGNLDLLLDISRCSKDAALESEVAERMAAVLSKVVAHAAQPIGTLLPELAFPGLFQGQAGILYTGCRLALAGLPSLSGQFATLSSSKTPARVSASLLASL